MTDQVAALAASLSPQEQDAMIGRFSWGDPIQQKVGETRLRALGLWPKLPCKVGDPSTTSLGDAVRDHILQSGRLCHD